MTILLSPSKQKNYAVQTCIPIPRVICEWGLSPERLNMCMQGLSSRLNTNISLFVNLTSAGSVVVLCCSEPWKARSVNRIWILLLY